MSKNNYLTTFQAAKLLMVTPDTVLKWIKSGKLAASRTIGGHFRIDREKVDSFLSNNEITHKKSDEDVKKDIDYCWEFYSDSGNIKDVCIDCIVYKAMAKKCFELSKISDELSESKRNCDVSCEECDFYNDIIAYSSMYNNIKDSEVDSVKLNKNEETESDPCCKGFLSDKDFWSLEIIEKMEQEQKIGTYNLTKEHWTVILYIKEYYQENRIFPPILKIVNFTGYSLTKISQLFPSGLVRGAYELAGLPKPAGCC